MQWWIHGIKSKVNAGYKIQFYLLINSLSDFFRMFHVFLRCFNLYTTSNDSSGKISSSIENHAVIEFRFDLKKKSFNSIADDWVCGSSLNGHVLCIEACKMVSEY